MHRNLRGNCVARSDGARRVHPPTLAATPGDCSLAFSRSLRTACRTTDRCLDSIKGHASAQRTIHGLADLGIRRVWVPVEQRLRRHDLTILTIATLRGLLLDPRLLQRMQFPVFREALERRHLATHC